MAFDAANLVWPQCLAVLQEARLGASPHSRPGGGHVSSCLEHPGEPQPSHGANDTGTSDTGPLVAFAGDHLNSNASTRDEFQLDDTPWVDTWWPISEETFPPIDPRVDQAGDNQSSTGASISTPPSGAIEGQQDVNPEDLFHPSATGSSSEVLASYHSFQNERRQPESYEPSMTERMCHPCNFEFQHRSDFLRHWRGTHLGERLFKCPISNCGYHEKGFARQDTRKCHVKKLHPELDQEATQNGHR